MSAGGLQTRRLLRGAVPCSGVTGFQPGGLHLPVQGGVPYRPLSRPVLPGVFRWVGLGDRGRGRGCTRWIYNDSSCSLSIDHATTTLPAADFVLGSTLDFEINRASSCFRSPISIFVSKLTYMLSFTLHVRSSEVVKRGCMSKECIMLCICP
jgi:hypothetical protein